jgi:hypothetical protein
MEIDADLLGLEPPSLEVWPDGARNGIVLPLARMEEGLSGVIEVTAAARAVTLRLKGGSPLVLEELRLCGSTLGGPGGSNGPMNARVCS